MKRYGVPYPPVSERAPLAWSHPLFFALRAIGVYVMVRLLALLAGAMMVVGLLFVFPTLLDWLAGSVSLAEAREPFALGALLVLVMMSAMGLARHLQRSLRRSYLEARPRRRRSAGEVAGTARPVRYDAPFVKYPEYPAYWPELRQLVLDRDGYRCGNCGAREYLHVHHIVPLSVGGSNELGNLRTLCRDCHALLHPHMRDHAAP